MTVIAGLGFSQPLRVRVVGVESLGAVAAGGNRAVTLIGVTDGFQQIRRLAVVRGRYFDADELKSAPKVCLLTEELAAAMFPHADPMGAIARVGDLRLTVIGVFKERVSTFGASEVFFATAICRLEIFQNTRKFTI